MKIKITTFMLFVFCIMTHGNAQQKTDGFFSNKYNANYTREYIRPNVGLNQNSSVGFNDMNINVDSAPVGNGLLVLTVMSASYLVLRRKEEKK